MSRFITLEGGEGAGKSTQARLLATALREQGHDVLLTREPGGTPGAELIRGLLLDPAGEWSPQAEILLHFAARADHLARAIQPALARGATVVCDRFADSTMAYQGHADATARALVTTLTGLLPIQPDLTLILDVAAPTRHARVAARAAAIDRYQAKDEQFHARVAAQYRAIAAAAPARCVLISAEGDIAAVHAEILRSLTQRPGLCPGPAGASRPRPA